MKLADLKEAKYYKHPAVSMIYQSRLQQEPLALEFPADQIESTVDALTQEFGLPEHEQQVWTGGSEARWTWDDFTVHDYDEFGFLESK